MSDEPPRSSQGLPPDPRGTNTPPAWWSILWSGELPDDRGRGDEPRARQRELEWLVGPDDPRSMRSVSGVSDGVPSRARAWFAITLLVTLCAVLVALGTLGTRIAPMLLAPLVAVVAIIAGVVAARRRRR